MANRSSSDDRGTRRNLASTLELLQRAQDGDGHALNLLFERYLPRLKRWARSRLPRGGRTLIETDEVVQDTLLQTLKRVNSFEVRGEGALQAYLRQGVLNRIRDEMRRARRKPEETEAGEELVDPGHSPLEEVIGREAVESYDAALRRLSEPDREAIIARIEMNLNYNEVAEALGKSSADAARMAVSRALVRLAREIGFDEEG